MDEVDITKLDIDGFVASEDTLSLYKVVKENVKDKIEVEIGDSKDLTTFQPQAKIMRWDNEVNLSVRYKDSDTSQLVADTKEDVVEWVKTDKEVHIYEKPEVAEDGGLEIEVVLKEKPISNVIEFSIETKGLDFFYQPELTQEEKDNGAERPENVVGSYAVYYKDTPTNYVGGKEYKTGKMCHIFRPEVVDAKGSEVWGELNVDIENSLLTVTIDKEWLEKAVYPVVVDPTFGYTTVGAAGSVGLLQYSRCGFVAGKYSLAETGTPSTITIRTGTVSAGSVISLIGAIYDTDKTNKNNDTDDLTGLSGAAAWRELTITSPSQLSTGDYYLAVMGKETTGTEVYPVAIPYDSSGVSNNKMYYSATYALPATLDGTNGTYKFSIYATYTEEAGGTEADSERAIYTKGKTVSSSTRLIYTKGKSSSSSERGVYTKGKGSSSSERGIYTSGSSTLSIDLFSVEFGVGSQGGSSERSLYTVGSIDNSSERLMYSKGVSTSSSTRNIHTVGELTSSSERLIHSKGVATDSSTRLIHTTGSVSADSTRGIFTKGVDTSSSTRNIHSTGSISESSTRNVYSKGIATSSSTRNIHTIGKLTGSSERLIHSSGKVTTSSTRAIYTTGQIPEGQGYSERAIYTKGVSTSSSTRGIYSKGSTSSSSTRAIYTKGSIETYSERSIYTKGVATSSSTRNIHSVGGGTGSSERGIYSLGEAVGSSQRGIYTKGTSGGAGNIYWYNGSGWELKQLYRYNGVAWEEATLKRYNGITWEDIT